MSSWEICRVITNYSINKHKYKYIFLFLIKLKHNMNIFLCELDRWMTDETALRQLLDKLNITQHPNLKAPVHFSELPCISRSF